MTGTKTITQTKSFKKDLNLVCKRGKDLRKLDFITSLLENGDPIPLKNRDHKLVGNMSKYRELHIEPDWLLIYEVRDSEIIFTYTGTHSDLLSK